MKFKKYDSTLEQINQIKNIESIHITDILSSNGGITHVMPCVMVSYNGNGFMNLCSQDKYFDVYIRRVTEVYNDEKNNIYEDSLTDPFGIRKKIIIDDHSRKILESEELLNISSMYSSYDGLDAYDNSLLFEHDLVNTLSNIIKFHVKQFIGSTTSTVSLGNISGYRRRYAFDGTLDGKEKYFPFTFECTSEREYHIQLAGIVNKEPIDILITYFDSKIRVILSVPNMEISDTSEYEVTDGIVKHKRALVHGKLTISLVNKDLPQVDNKHPEISNFDYDSDYTYFELPWGALYGIKTSIVNISPEEVKEEIVSSILEVDDNWFRRMDAYSLVYQRKSTPNRIGDKVTLDEYRSSLIGIKKDDCYLVETSFSDSKLGTGYYETNLNGKYFYHLVRKEDLYRIRSLTHDDVTRRSDLENKELIKALVKESSDGNI